MHLDSGPDTVVPPIYAAPLRYGMDTTIAPCDDFYGFVNGGWRAMAVLPTRQERGMRMVTMFNHVNRALNERLTTVLDSARTVYTTTDDATLRVLGTFYASCLVADTLESPIRRRTTQDTTADTLTRQAQCVGRVRAHLGAAAGQYFAETLIRTKAVDRMEQLLAALKTQVLTMLRENPVMTAEERAVSVDRIERLVLRVGIPKTRIDYARLTLDPTDYFGNKTTILNFFNALWVDEIGGNTREQWKASLLMANAMYMPRDHAIEIPTLMFTPPFFSATVDDLHNFAGIGYVIGHEIFHSVTPQLRLIADPTMNQEIERFMAFNTSMGTLDGWVANGRRTFHEDVADLGGGRVAYRAWKATLAEKQITPDSLVEGFTLDQRFFIAMGRVWRSKWDGGAPNHDVHGPHFARVNATVMQVPAFAKAFGCQEGDRMYLAPDQRSRIW